MIHGWWIRMVMVHLPSSLNHDIYVLKPHETQRTSLNCGEEILLPIPIVPKVVILVGPAPTTLRCGDP
jgi:hypothetical protein